MSDTITSILFCGVGGQGVLLASDITSMVALEAGLDVKKSEVHGMAQRGGNVDSHVRFGKKVYSPLISQGTADFMVSLEMVEPLRWQHMLKPDAHVLVNDQKIHSLFTGTGIAEYPGNSRQVIEETYPNAVFVDALGMAKEAGNMKAINTVMLGMLAKRLAFPRELWEEVIKKSLKPKLVDLNMQTFGMGWDI